MPTRFKDLYDPASIDLPKNFLPEHPVDTGALRIRDEQLAELPRNPDEIRRHIAEYYAMISHLDDAVGRLLNALEAHGERDNTLIVFAGDNGLAVGQHGLMGKQSLYDHSVRVPLLLSGPGIPAGVRRDDLVYLLDLYPTLCDWIGVPTPPSVEGRSFAKTLLQHANGPRSELFLAYSDSIRGLTDGKHKLIEYACGATQLFDLANDPQEMHNLAEEAKHHDLLSDMRTRLVALSLEQEDTNHTTSRTFWHTRCDWVGVKIV